MHTRQMKLPSYLQSRILEEIGHLAPSPCPSVSYNLQSSEAIKLIASPAWPEDKAA